MKQAKYKNSNYEAHKKVRKTWNVNPVERVVPHKTEVGAKLNNKQLLEMIEDCYGEVEEDFAFFNDPLEDGYYSDF